MTDRSWPRHRCSVSGEVGFTAMYLTRAGRFPRRASGQTCSITAPFGAKLLLLFARSLAGSSRWPRAASATKRTGELKIARSLSLSRERDDPLTRKSPLVGVEVRIHRAVESLTSGSATTRVCARAERKRKCVSLEIKAGFPISVRSMHVTRVRYVCIDTMEKLLLFLRARFSTTPFASPSNVWIKRMKSLFDHTRAHLLRLMESMKQI